MMEGGGHTGCVSFITDVIIDPCKHLSLARSCIICEVELQADTLSDTHTELKMIVTLVLGCYSSSTTIFLGSTALGKIREMD